jgi:REP element-mobilizing transposase RayT
MEHIVIGKQRTKTLTEEEVLDAMDEEIIEHMNACDMGIDEVLDYIEKNYL